MTQTHRDSPEMVARIDAVLDDIAETAEYQRDGGADYAERVHEPSTRGAEATFETFDEVTTLILELNARWEPAQQRWVVEPIQPTAIAHAEAQEHQQ